MIVFEVNSQRAVAKLQLLGQRAANVTEPMRVIAESLLSDARIALANGTGPGGTFAPQSPLTTKIHGAHPLLRQTGGLAASLYEDGPGNVFQVGPGSLTVGTNYRGPRSSYPVGSWIQDGTARTFHVIQFMMSKGRIREWSDTGIPARKFLAVPEQRRPQFVGLLRDFLLGRLAEVLGGQT